MDYMFYGCSGLINLDVSSFDTSRVTAINDMFNGCSRLVSLNVSGFDTSNVTNISDMFNGCSSLTSLDVSGFDTSCVIYFNSMFKDCSGLTDIDLSGFNTSKGQYFYSMFSGCSRLTGLDLSSWNTSSASRMEEMFKDCSGLTDLDLSTWNTSKLSKVSSMFENCTQLVTIYVSGKWSTRNVSSSYGSNVFLGCTSLVGGNGTPYNSDKTGYTMACIDTNGQEGYLTQKGGSAPTPVYTTAYFKKSRYSNQSPLYNSSTQNYNAKYFKHYEGTLNDIQQLIDNNTAVRVDDETTGYKIYCWYVNDSSASDYGTLYWCSDAEKVFLVVQLQQFNFN